MKTHKEIGEILKTARQKKGLTIEKVYNATRIQPKVIEALEEGKANEFLSRVYVLLLLKKYALFLGLDQHNLVENYKSLYKGKEEQVLAIEKKPLIKSTKFEKWPKLAVSGLLIFVFVFFILFLGIKSKSLASKPKPTIPKPLASEKQQETKTVFSIPKDKPIELVLKSTDDVWMRVKKDGKVVFEETLRKNTQKNWSANDIIELWVGRAEALNFSINGIPIGRIGEGKIKDIQISRLGLKIGNKWLLKAKE